MTAELRAGRPTSPGCCRAHSWAPQSASQPSLLLGSTLGLCKMALVNPAAQSMFSDAVLLRTRGSSFTGLISAHHNGQATVMLSVLLWIQSWKVVLQSGLHQPHPAVSESGLLTKNLGSREWPEMGVGGGGRGRGRSRKELGLDLLTEISIVLTGVTVAVTAGTEVERKGKISNSAAGGGIATAAGRSVIHQRPFGEMPTEHSRLLRLFIQFYFAHFTDERTVALRLVISQPHRE